MSESVHKHNVETKGTIDRYTVVVELDGMVMESFAIEGVVDTERAFEGMLNWFLIYRSKFFPTLTRDDIPEAIETAEQIDLPEGSPAISKHRCFIPIKNKDGEHEKDMELKATFSKFTWGMILNY